MAIKVISDHAALGQGLTLTVPKGPMNTQNTLYRAFISTTASLAGAEITITGLQDETVLVKAAALDAPLDFGTIGVPSETDTDIVLTIPGLAGVSIAAFLVADIAQ